MASRGGVIAAAILMASTLALPLWSTRMVAPQYQGEEALRVAVYAGRVHGDVAEIELLNEYVGVHLPLDTPELAAAPWVLGLLTALAVATSIAPRHRRRPLAAVLCALMVGVLVGGAALLQYRLYQMGHERSPTIMTGVPDFTPPVLGSKKIANFTAHMRLGVGAWAYLGAIALLGGSLWRGRRERREEGPPPDGAHPEKAGGETAPRIVRLAALAGGRS